VASAPYALLRGRALYPPLTDELDDDFADTPLNFEALPSIPLWCDPDSPDHPQKPGYKRLIYLHRFAE